MGDIMPSTNQAGTSTTYHCEHCRHIQEKNKMTIKAMLKGIRTRDELTDWMHALNKQDGATELKRFATEQA